MGKYVRPLPGLLLFAVLFFTSNIQAQAQGDCSERYRSKSFNAIQIFRNVVYSKNAPKLIAASLGSETVIGKDLVMDIFMPPPTDTVSGRPVVIIAHGGGFIDVAFMGGTLLVGTKDNDDVQALCDTFAHWGYVTACIEYRTGFDVASSSSIKRAVWRGAQDMSAAIRFFRKNSVWFNIDPDRIFIGGSSAGAFCAIHSTFADNNERIPETFQQSIFMADLGAMHSRPVVELTGFNPFTGNNTAANNVDSLPTALVSYWGAIADTAFFAGNNKAPMRMFHGTSDPVVSAQCAQPFASVVLAAPICCGSEIMNIALNSRNIPHQLSLEPGQGHEYWGALNGSWQPNSPNNFWLPIIESTATFFYDYMRPSTPQIVGPSVCAPNTIYNFSITNPQPGSDYCWEITSGNIVSANVNASTIDVIFNSGQIAANVKCSERDKADVLSLQRIKGVNIGNTVGTKYSASIENNFKIFPNPTESSFNFELEDSEIYSGLLIITDLLGKELMIIEIDKKITALSLQNQCSGNYLVRYINGKTIQNSILTIR